MPDTHLYRWPDDGLHTKAIIRVLAHYQTTEAATRLILQDSHWLLYLTCPNCNFGLHRYPSDESHFKCPQGCVANIPLFIQDIAIPFSAQRLHNELTSERGAGAIASVRFVDGNRPRQIFCVARKIKDELLLSNVWGLSPTPERSSQLADKIIPWSNVLSIEPLSETDFANTRGELVPHPSWTKTKKEEKKGVN